MLKLATHLPLAATLFASGLACQTIQASLVALQPLVLSQNGGAQVTHPAGPLTNASLTLGPSSLTVGLTPTALGHNLRTNLLCGFPSSVSSYYLADSELELTLTATAPTRATLRINARCQDDGGGSINLNVPGYGGVSFFNGSASGRTEIHHYLVDLSSTPLTISISQSAGGFPAGVSFLDADIELASSLSSPGAAGCGGLFYNGQPNTGTYQADHYLDLVDNTNPNSSGTLRASALGQWSGFLFGFTAPQLPLQLPAPFTASCPTLANVAVLTEGTVVGTANLPSAWEVTLPLFPPGGTFWVQHACAKVPTQSFPGNILWNTSNLVRIDT